MRNRVWFTSDTHAFHKNICKSTSQWGEGSKTRDFASLEEMNKAIIYGINNNVKEDDILYHLGDFTFGGIDKIWELRKEIVCKNIHKILGNHDHHVENNRELKIPSSELLVSSVVNFDVMANPFNLLDNKFCNVPASGLFSSVSHLKEITVDKQKIILCHYAMRVWKGSHDGWWHLYGHSHGSLEYEQYGKSMDVGIDTAFSRFGEYRPYSFEEIKEIMDKREIKYVDSHKKGTNV